ncbi:MAG: pyruvate kinase [Propionibacteriaceae bacterium]|nr:pyruvate kinase [Propionibacteriaceae bacterium]
MRKAKIVCTLGPATDSVEMLSALIKAGMDVARINMSHGSHEEHADQLDRLRQASEATGKSVTVFADLQGPKIRLGTFGEPVTLKNGQRFTITTDDVQGDVNRASTTLKSLTEDVRPGDAILIDDGNLTLKAVEVTATDVVCEVVAGGPVSDHKGINLPGVPVSVPALSEKDADDLRWALQQPVDLVALSFVRSAHDVVPVHAIMDEVGLRLPVIAKIEKPQAVHALDEIVDAFDAVMVARGDLGVEMPFEDVPLVQKRIITTARTWAKPVIVATQMLDSMIESPRPTRAEASDVANAVMDGADAVMLSGETSVGQYPVEAVQAMDRIVSAIEADGIDRITKIEWDPRTTSGVVAWGAARMARKLNVEAIVPFSYYGDTARRVARLRPSTPIVCFTPLESTRRQLGLVWGLTTFVSQEHEIEAMLREMDATLSRQRLAKVGDRVVVVYGKPLGTPAHTNTVYVHAVGQRDG